jgi:hypothetical protein
MYQLLCYHCCRLFLRQWTPLSRAGCVSNSAFPLASIFASVAASDSSARRVVSKSLLELGKSALVGIMFVFRLVGAAVQPTRDCDLRSMLERVK